MWQYYCVYRPFARSENLGGAGGIVVGIICPPGWDRVN